MSFVGVLFDNQKNFEKMFVLYFLILTSTNNTLDSFLKSPYFN